eukprot:jgi/Phyca11/108009/e_gw1.14.752.1
MLIFKNKSSSYPIQWLPDSVKGVCYRSSPSAFINGRLMTEWLEEPRCWGPGGPFASSRTLWMDNASGHFQPADRFPIQRTKEHWRRLCELRNMEAIRNGDWKQGASSSGKLANPGKVFFKLAIECIELVNSEKNAYGFDWTKTYMVQCGLDVPLMAFRR